MRGEDLVTSANETSAPRFMVGTGVGFANLKTGVAGIEERTVEWPEEDECWCCRDSA